METSTQGSKHSKVDAILVVLMRIAELFFATGESNLLYDLGHWNTLPKSSPRHKTTIASNTVMTTAADNVMKRVLYLVVLRLSASM